MELSPTLPIVSTHSRLKAAVTKASCDFGVLFVSTHSRLKAAAVGRVVYTRSLGFNTQPPEGGWDSKAQKVFVVHKVSTHSRPKAAGNQAGMVAGKEMFQHTAARRRLAVAGLIQTKSATVSTHSRPKAAGRCK